MRTVHYHNSTLFAVVWLLILLLSSFLIIPPAAADIGTATSYDPPYLPTKCRGNRQDQFPQDGHFLAASDGVWDNGAACGRKYRVRCISGLRRPCKEDTVVAQVVDFCRVTPCPTTFVLSNKAFDAISKLPHSKINIEFSQI